MTNHRHNVGKTRSRFHTLTMGLIWTAAAAVALLWAWNGIAAGLFALPAAKFVHAVSFVAAIVTLVAILRSTAHRRLNRHPRGLR